MRWTTLLGALGVTTFLAGCEKDDTGSIVGDTDLDLDTGETDIVDTDTDTDVDTDTDTDTDTDHDTGEDTGEDTGHDTGDTAHP